MSVAACAAPEPFSDSDDDIDMGEDQAIALFDDFDDDDESVENSDSDDPSNSCLNEDVGLK